MEQNRQDGSADFHTTPYHIMPWPETTTGHCLRKTLQYQTAKWMVRWPHKRGQSQTLPQGLSASTLHHPAVALSALNPNIRRLQNRNRRILFSAVDTIAPLQHRARINPPLEQNLRRFARQAGHAIEQNARRSVC